MTVLLFSLFFFFQAEDGIRDSSVTGVQTCALPIFPEVECLVDQVADRLTRGLDPLHWIRGLQDAVGAGEEGLDRRRGRGRAGRLSGTDAQAGEQSEEKPANPHTLCHEQLACPGRRLLKALSCERRGLNLFARLGSTASAS